ncbi:MAG: hypothetical protein ACYDHX_11590 [Methanothrix sp.]
MIILLARIHASTFSSCKEMILKALLLRMVVDAGLEETYKKV